MNNRRQHTWPFLALLYLFFVRPTNLQAIDYYVTVGGTGTGSSWNDATDLQTALGTAAFADNIYVASGTYTPDAI